MQFKFVDFFSIKGYTVSGYLGAGIVGERWSLSRADSSRTFVAELFDDTENPHASLAKNMEIARKFRHPLIIGMADCGKVAEGTFYVISDGPSAVSNPFSQAEPITEQFIWNCIGTVIEGLAVLHKSDCVHSLLCPSTILYDGYDFMLSHLWWIHDSDGRPYCPSLADYFPSNLPSQFEEFCAPELKANGKPGKPADIFSFGATLFYWLTGHCPGQLDAQDVELSLANSTVELPDELSSLISSMLSANASDRPTASRIIDIVRSHGVKAVLS